MLFIIFRQISHKIDPEIIKDRALLVFNKADQWSKSRFLNEIVPQILCQAAGELRVVALISKAGDFVKKEIHEMSLDELRQEKNAVSLAQKELCECHRDLQSDRHMSTVAVLMTCNTVRLEFVSATVTALYLLMRKRLLMR